MSPQIHIASLIVHVRPEGLDALAAALAGWPGLEVAATDPSGKLVAVLETATEREVLEVIDRIHQQPGVLAANLVYHHVESAESLAEPLPATGTTA